MPLSLDDEGLFREADPSGLYGLIYRMPEQIETILDVLADTGGPEQHRPVGKAAPRQPCPASAQRMPQPAAVRHILLVGVGSAAVSAMMTQALAGVWARIPILRCEGYGVPAFAGRGTLAVVASVSGNTPEVVDQARQLSDGGAELVAVTRGGALGELARERGFHLVTLPDEPPSNRTVFPYLLVPMLRWVERWALPGCPDRPALGTGTESASDAVTGSVSSVAGDLAEACDLLRSLRSRLARDVPASHNLAKQLAQRLVGRLPLLYGSQFVTGAVALRWKNQFNENSKILAYSGFLPELSHNEAVPWGGLAAGRPACVAGVEAAAVVLLRDQGDDETVSRRVELLRDAVADGGVEPLEVWLPEGRSLLARALAGVFLGDMVSFYLACARGVDPAAVPGIDALRIRR